MQIICRSNLKRALVAMVFLIVLTLASCVFDTGGEPTPLDPQPAPTDDSGDPEETASTTQTPELGEAATPTLTETPAGITAGLVIGRANLVYTFKVRDGDVLIGDGETIIPLRFRSIGDEGHYIFTETLPGTQVTSLAGGTGQGIVCHITYTLSGNYSIDGDFYEDGCRFEFTFEGDFLAEEETGNSCGFSGTSGAHLFYPPPFGPHIITEDNNPITIKPEPRLTHIFRIEDVELPTSITCW